MNGEFRLPGGSHGLVSVNWRPQAGRWSAPFPNDREQQRGSKDGEYDAVLHPVSMMTANQVRGKWPMALWNGENSLAEFRI
jgi:hypothetical protein